MLKPYTSVVRFPALAGRLTQRASSMSSLGSWNAAQKCIVTSTRPMMQQHSLTGTINVRGFLSVASIPGPLLAPAVFAGLLITLWSYKCAMAVVFQDKIIYMPYMPPFARSEKLQDYTAVCQPVQWSEVSIRSIDRTKLSLCVGEVILTKARTGRRIVLCYFQGNGASLPPRLPMLSNVLKAATAILADGAQITLVALSYRGYWKSSGRATEAGIRLDAQAMLSWVGQEYGPEVEIILWGQSIGAGVACAAAAEYKGDCRVISMILETPFTSIKNMLVALYPQKWLPYQYLWPFLWNHWDNGIALRHLAQRHQRPRVLLLIAKRDEVVPRAETDTIEQWLSELNFDAKRTDIFGSLHTEATTRREGQQAIADHIVDLVKTERRSCVRGTA